MNISGWISRHVKTLVHLYHFCIRRNDEIIFISVALFLFPLHRCLVPGMIHWSGVWVDFCYITDTRRLIWKILFILALLRKAQEAKTYQPLKSSSLFFVLCFLLESDFNQEGFWRPFLVIWNFLITWSGLIMGEWHSLSPLTVQFLWTGNSQFEQHKPSRIY